MAVFYHGELVSGLRGPSGPDGNPLGTIVSFMGSAAPDGYLACDGAVYNIASYPELSTFFLEQFGAKNHFGGDGETTFAVPDLRNLFLRGYHGEAEEQLSGEIGQKQEATRDLWLEQDKNGNFTVGGNMSDRHTDRCDTLEAYGGGYCAYHNDNYQAGGVRFGMYTARPVNMAVLYCIKAVTSGPVLEEYATEDGWHVRKWADGYVEMCYSARKVYTDYTVSMQDFLSTKAGAVKHLPLPVPLVEKYREWGGVSTFSGASASFLMTEGTDPAFYLDKTQNYMIMAFGAVSPPQDLRVEIFVTGRWK